MLDIAEKTMIFWVTGRAGSGKSTLARKLAKQLNAVVLDGDDFRRIFPEDFTPSGRERNQRRITEFAKLLFSQDVSVVISCVSPVKALRKDFQSQLPGCIELQLPGGTLWDGTEYEE